MGNGDTPTAGGGPVAGDGGSGETTPAFLVSEVGLGLNMQQQQQHQSLSSSYHFNKMTNFMPSSSGYYYHQPTINNQITSGFSLEPSSGSDSGGKCFSQRLSGKNLRGRR
ncbi:hypothetical protein OSB04_022279 [Centaurea solstitialis]|uniref:Uncharacterized protein n=1 Tax=Centaurea solstitialis TaxID=347529 RepID=A0AA38T999_9ASTR|nr:hypothetical protein OSB04_022279 [Centaurea solstitialis]